MNRKLKLALAALLGFSTACSTVRNAPGSANEPSDRKGDAAITDNGEPTEESVRVERIMLMYGVPSPRPVPAEQPADETPTSPEQPTSKQSE